MSSTGEGIDNAVLRSGWLRREGWFLAGAVASVAVAVGLFTRFSIDGTLTRDESVYAYGGQRLAHGVPPYVSIFDTKTPLATVIAGAAARAAHVLGRNDLYLIRATFFVCAVLAVLAAYLLGARLWRSVTAGVVSAVVLASFSAFAADALAGPDAKTPGVMFALLSMWLMARRDWFWAALTGSLAMLVWQPLAAYPIVAVVLALLIPGPGQRLRSALKAVGGAALPVVVLVVYFLASGAFDALVEAAFRFPLAGLHRKPMSWTARVERITDVASQFLGFGAVLFWAGLALLVAAVVVHLVRRRFGSRDTLTDPLVAVVLTTLLLELGFATTDFQSYPDLYPLLPYAALGWGGAVALLQRAAGRVAQRTGRRTAPGRAVVTATTAMALAGVVVLTMCSWSALAKNPLNDRGLVPELRSACGLHRMVGPHRSLWALGDPTPLVLLHRENPDRFIYLDSGVDAWKIHETPGGFYGWVQQIVSAKPSVVVMHRWLGERRIEMAHALHRAGYLGRFVGSWRVFVTPAVARRAPKDGVLLTKQKTVLATDPAGRPLPAFGCHRVGQLS